MGEWVRRAEHPLRCGIRGKLYSRHDFVTPISDCIGELYSRFSRLRAYSFISKAERRVEREAAAFTVAIPKVPPTGAGASSARADSRPVLCGCGSTETFVDSENFVVCTYCGAIKGQASMGATYGETSGEGRRADAPKATGCVSVLSGFRTASLIAAKSTGEKDVLPKRVATRLADTVVECEKLASRIGPVEPVVLAEVRRCVGRVIRRSYKHSVACGRQPCLLLIHDRTAALLARCTFAHTVGRLAVEGITGVSRSSIELVHARLQALASESSLTAWSSTACALEALESEATDLAVVCVPIKRKAEPQLSAVSLKRVASSDADLAVSAPPCTTQVRNAIHELDLSPALRSEAVASLVGSSPLAAAVRSGRLMKGSTPAAIADVVVAAVARRRMVEAPAGPSGISEHVDAAFALLPPLAVDEDDLL